MSNRPKSPESNSKKKNARSEKTGSTTRSSSSSAFRLLRTEPSRFFSELLDAFDAWRTSRDWAGMFWFLPAFLLLVVCSSAVLWGSMRSKDDLLRQYLSLAEKEFPIEDSLEPKSDAKSEESQGQYAELIYRRILQLESNNKTARYYVAAKMASTGNLLQARTMMRELAPDRSAGYPPAHAWMALDTPRRFQGGEKVDPIVYAHHVEQAALWEKAPASIILLRVRMLEEKQELDEAIRLLRKWVPSHPEFRIAIAEICLRSGPGRETQGKEELAQAQTYYSERLGTVQETDNDRMRMAQTYLLSNDFKNAKDVLAKGLDQNPNRPILRRLLADILVKEYRNSVQKTENGVQANIEHLNVALQLDPNNPSAGEEIAQLSLFGAKADSTAIEALMKQIESGQASAVTHLILANNHLSQGRIKEAMGHWELSLAKNPNMVLALNNLSVTLTRVDPPQIDRALQMIERAIVIAGKDPELLDSKGTILLAAGKRFEAIAQFENSIKASPGRIQTREKLAKAYEQEGMVDAAAAQKSAIEKLIELKQKQSKEKVEP